MTEAARPWGRYAELRPDELAAIRAQLPVAYLPWGGLVWHGPHLPLGVDGIVAEALAERAARRTGGIVLPGTWLPLAGGPQASGLGLSAATLRAVLDDMFAGLARGGWQVAVVLSGHHAPGHELALMDAAEEAIASHGLLTLAVPPLALVDEEMLDHAGLWESSLLLALRPELVRLAALGGAPLKPASSGVLGRDPRDTASASLGLSALHLAIERLNIAVSDLLARGDPAPLRALYAQRRDHYRSLISRVGTAPEAVNAAWWKELLKPDTPDA